MTINSVKFLKALIVEDSDLDFRLLERNLRRQGYQAETQQVNSAPELDDALASGNWDVILADCYLPGFPISSLLSLLEERERDIPVILISGIFDEEEAIPLLRAGAHDFILKDRLARLGAAIERERREASNRHARRQAERQLRRSEERLALAIRASNSAVWWFDIHPQVADRVPETVQLSAEMKAFIGFADHEFPNSLLAWHERLHPTDQRVVDQQLRACLSGLSNHYGLEYRIRHRDGSFRWLDSRGMVQRDINGTPQCWVGLDRDITEQKHLEEKLRQAAAVLDSTAEGVFVTDLEGHIQMVNQAFSAITGFAAHEALGNTPRLWKSGYHDRDFYQVLWGHLQSSGHWRGEVWNRRKSGEIYPQLLTASTVYDDQGIPSHYVGVFTDISQLKHSQEQLDYLTHHDALTALPNRLLLTARLDHTLNAITQRSHGLALILIDLYGFKHVNDSLGHEAGDRLLQAVAQRLQQHLTPADTLARLAGDEFALLCETPPSAINIGQLVEGWLALFHDPFPVEDQSLRINAVFGISLAPADGKDATTLLQHAHNALHRAKEKGAGTYEFYAHELTERARQQVRLDTRLHQALQESTLQVYYQPQFCAADQTLIGAEALLRWHDTELGMISPAVFIPLAEERGIIRLLGDWVLQRVCQDLRRWREQGLMPPRIAVNLSVRQLEDPQLLPRLLSLLQDHRLESTCLELELTESSFLAPSDRLRSVLQTLRDAGFHLSVDDFGTGYSSLSYLKRLPIQTVKIDRSFITALPEDDDDRVIVQAIVALARQLRLQVVVEGVETSAQLALLRDIGCDVIQGFLLGKPQPADHFAQHLVNLTTIKS